MAESKVAREQIETDQSEFQQFVVNRISILVSGQERIEQLVIALLKQEPTVDFLSDEAYKHHAKENFGDAALEGQSIAADVQSWCDHGATTIFEAEQGADSSNLSMTKHITEHYWPATLSPEWPRSLKVRHVSDEGDHDGGVAIMKKRSTLLEASAAHRLKKKTLSAHAITETSDKWRLGKFMLTPTHPIRLTLDFLSVVCLIYDLLAIPFFLAWGFKIEGFWQIIQTSVMVYWTIDIIASFRTGYIFEGEVVTDSRKIAMRYIRGSFVVEFAIVFIDWISFFITADEGAEDTAKVFRMGKFYRLLRLLGVVRMAKVMSAFHRIANRNFSRKVQLGLEMFKLLITVVYINHVLGCIWFALSFAHTDTGARWTDLPIAGGGGPYADTTAFFQYSSAIHWSLTQMTPGSMQINAQNSLERIFNIFCLVFGVLFFSSLISTLSAKMVQINSLNQTRMWKLSVMMTFLQERSVGSSMSYLIKQQVEERMEAKAPLLQQNVEALRLVSKKLQAELHFIVCTPLLSTHPLILVMLRLDKGYFTQMCFRVMDFYVYSRLDTLFTAGLQCSGAFVISRGSLNYTQRPETALVSGVVTREIYSGSWLCEAALWSEWIHVGTAECNVTLEVLNINAEQIVAASATNLLFKYILLDYGKTYHDRLCSLPRATIPTDICGDAIQSAQIISTSSKDLQLLVSNISFEILAEAWAWSLKGKPTISLLQEELRKGQTMLMPISEESVCRWVHVLCLKLCREDGCKFVAVGKWDRFENVLKPDVKLPGTKLANYEGPDAALARLLDDKFGSLKDAILVHQREDKTEVSASSRYLIDTQYAKYMYEATFDDEYQLPPELTSSQPSLSVTEELAAYPSETTFYIDDRNGQPEAHVYAWVSPQLYDKIFGSASGQRDECMRFQKFDISRAVSLAGLIIHGPTLRMEPEGTVVRPAVMAPRPTTCCAACGDTAQANESE